MRYILLIHDEEAKFANMPAQEMERLMSEYGRVTEEMQMAGVYRDSARLRPVTTATTVRVREDDTMTTDGPFAETKEQLGGFYMIDVKDLDEALGWAAKIPSARIGFIEVRPIWEH